MSRPEHEVADIIRFFGSQFIQKHQPNSYQLRVLRALSSCRTSALGGHIHRCDKCGFENISYNSCRNRHCPKCQGIKQAFWVEDRIRSAYPVKHYHIVFTMPEVLNQIIMLDSKGFYNLMFASVWDVLYSFGYSHFAAEGGAICILHTWGQNISLHPHIHCIIPSLGHTLRGNLKLIGKSGKYLYPVVQLSLKFRGRFLTGVKEHLSARNILQEYLPQIRQAWNKPWVVYCEPSLGKAENVVGYLGQYTHRVAITNHRIVSVDDEHVGFTLKDYSDDGRQKTTILTGEEFLRRFCLHILPSGFVKIRYYGIYSSRFRSTLLKGRIIVTLQPDETVIERITRLIGLDISACPRCKKGKLVFAGIIPRSRSPTLVLPFVA
jgi:hypothetical protein